MKDNHSTTTPRIMRLERRGILYGVSVLTPEGWLIFDPPAKGFGKMSPEQWVLARLRALKAAARPRNKPKPRQTQPATRSKATRMRRGGTTMQPSPPPGGRLQISSFREGKGGAKRDRTADPLKDVRDAADLSSRTRISSSNHRAFMRDATTIEFENLGFSEVRQPLIILKVAQGSAPSKQLLDCENLLLRFQQQISIDDIQRFISVVSLKEILIQWFSFRSQSATSLLPFNKLLI